MPGDKATTILALRMLLEYTICHVLPPPYRAYSYTALAELPNEDTLRETTVNREIFRVKIIHVLNFRDLMVPQ